MAKLKRRSISLFARLRNYFITGIVVLVPIGITLYLTKFFISISSKLIPYNLNPNNYLPYSIPGIEIISTVKTTGPTGVEMEALTAASISALTVYDMVKSLDKSIIVKDLRLIFKDGGKSGLYESS